MTAHPNLAATVSIVAERLNDIATTVAAEATQLTYTIRQIGEHARLISSLAVELEHAADQIDLDLQAQFAVVAAAREGFASNEPALAALNASADVIGSMSAKVREIAVRSRLLSLNAQIEAARNGGGAGFSAVASEMGELAKQTRSTTQEIDAETAQISTNVSRAGALIQAGTNLLEQQHAVMGSIATAATGQRTAAGQMLMLTAETVEQVDHAALGIGRVASAASIVGVLARQMTKLSRPPEELTGVD